MSTRFQLKTAVAGAALALAVALPASSAAFAQSSQAQLQQLYHAGQYDAFGAQHDYSIRAARSARSPGLTANQRAPLESEYRTGEESSFDAGQTSGPLTALRGYSSRVASSVPMVNGHRDLIGDHGPQDALANQIYQPGSRPPGW